jgi:hypothetical protein
MKNTINGTSLTSLAISLSFALPLLAWGLSTTHDTVFGRGSNTFFFLLIAIFIYKFIRDTVTTNILEGQVINKCLIKILIRYYLLSFAIYFLFNTFLTHKINVGIPFGHAGDFFHILDLSYANSYSEISQIGYLPGLLSITKIMSIFFMKKDGLIDRNFYGWALYLAFFSLSLYAICRPAIKVNFAKIGLPIFFIFFTSYPFLLELERGNLVILSMFFLAISIQSYNFKSSSIYIGLFSTLKALNIVFLPSFLFSRRIRVTALGASILISGLILPLILFYLSDGKLDYDGLLGRLSSTGSFPDAHVAVAHSGAYAALTFLQGSGFFMDVDRPDFLNNSIILLLAFLVLYYCFEFYFFILKRKPHSKKDLCFSLISIFIMTKLFHQNNTDMNLILLFPMIIQLFLEKLSFNEKLIFSLLLLLLFPFYVNILFGIEDSNSIFYYSSRTLIFTIIYINILILSFSRFFEIFKRQN